MGHGKVLVLNARPGVSNFGVRIVVLTLPSLFFEELVPDLLLLLHLLVRHVLIVDAELRVRQTGDQQSSRSATGVPMLCKLGQFSDFAVLGQIFPPIVVYF